MTQAREQGTLVFNSMPQKHEDYLRYVRDTATDAARAFVEKDDAAGCGLLYALLDTATTELELAQLERSRYALYCWWRQEGGQYRASLTPGDAGACATVTLFYKNRKVMFQAIRQTAVGAMTAAAGDAAANCWQWGKTLDRPRKGGEHFDAPAVEPTYTAPEIPVETQGPW